MRAARLRWNSLEEPSTQEKTMSTSPENSVAWVSYMPDSVRQRLPWRSISVYDTSSAAIVRRVRSVGRGASMSSAPNRHRSTRVPEDDP